MRAKWMLACLMLTLSFSASGDGFQAFTAKDGRTIEAKVAKYDPRTKKVTLELRSGKKKTVDAGVFAAADQLKIKDWYLATQMFSPSKLVVKIEKKTVDSGHYRGKDGERHDTGQWLAHYTGVDFENIAFSLSVNNRSTVALEGVLVEFSIVTQSERHEQEGVMELKPLDSGNGSGWYAMEEYEWNDREKSFDTRGKWTIDSLAPKKKAGHLTEPVKLREGALTWHGTPRGKKKDFLTREIKDEVRGIVVRVSIPLESGGFARKEYSYPSDFAAKASVDWEKRGRKHPNELERRGGAAAARSTAPKDGSREYTAGMDYRLGRNGKTKDIQKAIKFFEISGHRGTPKSYSWIGDIHERGDGVPKDWVKAAAYYEKAYKAGWENGAYNLGNLYLRGGHGIARDEALGLEWFEKGAAQESKSCLMELAWYYGGNDSAAKRDGVKAAAYADRMMVHGSKSFLYIGTAAAAYAEAGRFEEAVKTQKQVVAIINEKYPEEEHAGYRREFQENLERYQRGEAYPTKW